MPPSLLIRANVLLLFLLFLLNWEGLENKAKSSETKHLASQEQNLLMLAWIQVEFRWIVTEPKSGDSLAFQTLENSTG